MDNVTMTFLIIGGLGLAVLAVSLLVGDLLHFGHPDVDGPFSVPAVADLVGTLGVVVTPIPVDGYGEVRVRLGGQPVKLYARSERPLPLGTRVFVIEAPSSTSVLVEETPSIKEL